MELAATWNLRKDSAGKLLNRPDPPKLLPGGVTVLAVWEPTMLQTPVRVRLGGWTTEMDPDGCDGQLGAV